MSMYHFKFTDLKFWVHLKKKKKTFLLVQDTTHNYLLKRISINEENLTSFQTMSTGIIRVSTFLMRTLHF